MKTILTAAAVVLAAVLLVGLFAGVEAAAALLAIGSLGMSFAVKDAQLKKTKALPNGAASTTSDGIDLGHGSFGDILADCELLISAPALTTAEQPDAKTLKYTIEHDTDPAFGTVATLLPDVLTQTGAGGAGAAAATKRVRFPTDSKRHIRVKATGSAIGDSSAKSFTVEILT